MTKMKNLEKEKIINLRKKFKKNSSYKHLRESMEIIGNEDRFLILDLLNEKPCFLADVEESLDKSQPSISHHLRILENHKLIKSTQKGKFKQYSIVEEKFRKLLDLWNGWVQLIRLKNY
jgi:ArsR family transcriptional regulator, arsenate/arsenite/antimonite-responsive transcriptional repressor